MSTKRYTQEFVILCMRDQFGIGTVALSAFHLSFPIMEMRWEATTSNSTVHTVPYSTLYKLVQSRIVRYTHTIRYTVRYTMRYGVPYTKVWTTLYRVGIPKILDQMTLDQITLDQFTGTLYHVPCTMYRVPCTVYHHYGPEKELGWTKFPIDDFYSKKLSREFAWRICKNLNIWLVASQAISIRRFLT